MQAAEYRAYWVLRCSTRPGNDTSGRYRSRSPSYSKRHSSGRTGELERRDGEFEQGDDRGELAGHVARSGSRGPQAALCSGCRPLRQATASRGPPPRTSPAQLTARRGRVR
jgi:hypothetical protein